MSQRSARPRLERLRSPTDVVDVSGYFGEESLDDTFVTLTDDEVESLTAAVGDETQRLRSVGSD
ncbi:hypothetical protein [Halobaculum sp. MBLA0143]|uniref:hypothetical protein n=1 Tax=Halobaculum sp. MBLA0143 TaxID=3079933 RepID=UPI003523BD40